MIIGNSAPDGVSGLMSRDPFDELSPWIGQNQDESDGDVSPRLSNYSSCEGSEFERYCSANSALGTASVCSSVGNCNEFLESDLGSSKRFSFGGEDSFLLANDCERGTIRSTAITNSRVMDSVPNDAVETHRGLTGATTSEALSDESIMLSGLAEKSGLGLYPALGAKCSETNGMLMQSDYENQLESLWSDEGFLFHYDGYERSLHEKRTHEDVSLSSPSSTQRGMCQESNGDYFLFAADGKTSQTFQYSHEDSLPETSLCEGSINNVNDQDGRNLGFGLPGVSSEHSGQFQSREVEEVGEKDTDSQLEHENSDDMDSMLDSGTDEEQIIHENEKQKFEYVKSNKLKDENPFFITSRVAFGSADWDEFEQEMEQNNLASLPLHEPRKIEGILGAENDLLNCATDQNSKNWKLEEVVQDITGTTSQTQALSEKTEERFSHAIFLSEQKGQRSQTDFSSNIDTIVHDGILNFSANQEPLHRVTGEVSESEKELLQNPLSDVVVGQLTFCTDGISERNEMRSEDSKPSTLFLTPKSSHKQRDKESTANNLAEGSTVPEKVEKFNMEDIYEEVVYDMEQILFDSAEPRVPRFNQSEEFFPPHSKPFRDGSSTASTSGTDDRSPLGRHPPKIRWIEVIGAKQKRGDVSLGERLVGVKEYTVYMIKVWCVNSEWEVERRYRDFFALYRQLRTVFAEHGLSLPSPWSSVEKESRKIFGNVSPKVVSERSTLIQDCLRSILLLESSLATPSCLVWFLSSDPVHTNQSMPNTLDPHFSREFLDYSNGEKYKEGHPTLGKTISLMIDIHPRKSMKQLLEAQNYMCAGCHKHLEGAKTLMKDFAKTLGWGKPRLCEYTGQLFCVACHTNDTSVVPARVLHLWDFSLYPVSQLAKAYLESIFDQPMLCVSAVNPFLFSRVPALLHVMALRKKIGAMLAYVRCPFRRSIQKGLGPRRYLLEGNEFFALRDLVDLSKGAFSGLPVLVENVSKKVLEHITQQCLVCYDTGLACGARQACEDPSSFIFPFQEEEIKRCRSCNTVFHKPCFSKLVGCPCGNPAEIVQKAGHPDQVMQGTGKSNGVFGMSMKTLDYKSLFSGLLSKAKEELAWGPRNDKPVILMASLPSTSL